MRADDQCAVVEIVQYSCTLSPPSTSRTGSDPPHIVCDPLVRLFKRCAGKPSVEITPPVADRDEPASRPLDSPATLVQLGKGGGNLEDGKSERHHAPPPPFSSQWIVKEEKEDGGSEQRETASSPSSSPTAKYSIVGCHGWLDNANTFDMVAGPLCKNPDVAFYSIDLSGHGLSSHLAGHHKPYFHTPTYIGEVYEVLQYFGLDKVVLIGHSMGGGILVMFAAVFPERVSHLVLIENIGYETPPVDKLPVRLRAYFDQRFKGPDAPVKRKPTYSSIQAAIDARSNAKLALPLSAARTLTARGLEAVYNQSTGQIEYTWRTDEALTFPQTGTTTEEAVLSFLRHIQCDVLLVFGEGGYFDLQRPQTSTRLQALAKKRIITVQGGHHPHLEDGAKDIVDGIQALLGLPRELPAKL
ncbi:hypothetical protein RI367_007590 [Sorochytrium milnesiophthora]